LEIVVTCDADPCINPTFCRTCRKADDHKPRTSRWYVYDRTQLDGAPQPTVEALMYSLRERGTKALEETDTKLRLSDLSERQVVEVGNRLQRLKPEIARKWTKEEVKTLFQARTK
jgi:hypothetical protein